jgi:hypothetical protein
MLVQTSRVNAAGGGKLLLFAHHRTVMNQLQEFLDGHLDGFKGPYVPYIRIDGNCEHNLRHELQRKFMYNPEIKACLRQPSISSVHLIVGNALRCIVRLSPAAVCLELCS